MSNVLREQKKQQVIITLGRLGWSLRRIQRATGVRRETAAAYLKAEGIVPAKPTTPVITDFGAEFAERRNGRGTTTKPESCRQDLHTPSETHRGGIRIGPQMPWRSDRSWWTPAASPIAIRASAGSSANCTPVHHRRLGLSLKPNQAIIMVSPALW